jgi:signal transduction histidine kinase
VMRPSGASVPREAATSILGRSARGADGRLLGEDELPLVRSLREGAIVDGAELTHTTPAGVLMSVRVHSGPVRTPDGRIIAAVALMQDVSAEKRAAEEKKRNDAFQELIHAMLGHDLRNPLAAIVTSASVLERRAGSDDRDLRSIRRILSASERMTRMINQLLDLTRTRHGGALPILRTRTDLHELVRRVADELETAQPSHRIELDLQGNGVGEWDPDRLAQLVSNLVGNAREHGTKETPVLVRVGEAGDEVQLTITNHGPGIPHEHAASIFDPFRRLAGPQPSRAKGLGLGLYICQQIAHGHGGRIDVSSTGGETTFTVTLPRRG